MRSDEEEIARSKTGLIIGIAFLLHMLAVVISAIGFFSPFWMVEINTGYRTGLWGRCDYHQLNCIWFNQRDYAWEKILPDWHKASQIIFAIGIGLLALTFFFALAQLIFRCCKTFIKLPLTIGIIIAFATVLEMISIIVFGANAYKYLEVSLNSWVGNFDWAFYVAIVGLLACAASSFFYVLGGRKFVKDMKYYEASYS